MDTITFIIIIFISALFLYGCRFLFNLSADESNINYKGIIEDYNASLDEDGKTDIDAYDVLTLEAVGGTRQLGFVNALPGILVGLGIFGTFLGLAKGVGEFSEIASDNNELKNQIFALMGGMETAFYTSIAGMGLSLLFTIFQKYRMAPVKSHLDFVAYQLNKQHLATFSYYINKQTSAFNYISANFGDNLSRSLNDALNDISKSLYDSAEKFANSTNLYGNTIFKYSKSTLDLGESVTMLKQEIVDKFANSISQFDATFDEMVIQLTIANDALKGTISDFNDSSSELKNSINKLTVATENIKTVTDSIPQMSSAVNEIAHLVPAFSEVSKNQNECISKSAEALKEVGSLGNAVSAIMQTIDGMKSSFEGMCDVASSMKQSMIESSDKLKVSTGNLASFSQNIANMKSVVDNLHSSIEKQLDTLKIQTADLSEMDNKFQLVFKEINKGIGDYANSLTAGTSQLISDYTTAFTKACQETNNTTQKMTAASQRIADAIQKLSQKND